MGMCSAASLAILLTDGGSCIGAYAITAIVPWFTAPWWAAVSDRVGRKPILLLSTVGIMVAEIPILITLALGGTRMEHVGAGRLMLSLGVLFHSLLGGVSVLILFRSMLMRHG